MTLRPVDIAILTALLLCASALRAQAVAKILVGAGKTYVIDSIVDIERVSIAAPEVADAVPVNKRTVMINGKAPGETSAIVWLTDGSRRQYDVNVSFAASRMEAAKLQIAQEFGDGVQLTGDTNAVYLTGRVKDLFASERAQAIGEAIGKVVNLLKVDIPPQEQQILLRVKFADVDRSKSTDLGINFIGAPQGIPFNVTTGANSPSRFTAVNNNAAAFNLSDALNILMFDPHLNTGATIKALQASNVLQILAEPNLLAMNGHDASFVAGGEFPFPTLQGGGNGVGQVTIQFREFGIKLHFTPTLTPRGTIRLHVAPEVSSLDYANALTSQGTTVPALNTRKIETEVELENGQSFAIAGLLDQRTTESLSRIPGLADIPIIGKFFTSKSVSRGQSELLVIVTPELVAPVPADKPAPDLERPLKFLEGDGVMTSAPRTPGPDLTGPPPAKPGRSEIPVQEMEQYRRDQQLRQYMTDTSASAPSASGTGASPASLSGPAATDSQSNPNLRRPGDGR